MKKKLTVETLFNFVLTLVIIGLSVWGIRTIYNNVVSTNQYIVHLEKRLIEEEKENDNFYDLIDLAIDNAVLEEQLEWYEEHLEVMEYVYELEAFNEFLKENVVTEIVYVDKEVVVYVTEIEYVEVPVVVEVGYTQEEVENIIEEFIDFAIMVDAQADDYEIIYDEDLQLLYLYRLDINGISQLDELYTMEELIEITK